MRSGYSKSSISLDKRRVEAQLKNLGGMVSPEASDLIEPILWEAVEQELDKTELAS